MKIMANCRWISHASPTKGKSSREAGFNLVEMIVVIAITGILSSIVAVFIKGPVSGYIDTTRRAGLTDIADTALRRISRDLHLALPNSVRVSPDGSMLEFLQTSGGGRYREVADPNIPGSEILNFTVAGSKFDYLGPSLIAAPYNVAIDQFVVISNFGVAPADAYTYDVNTGTGGNISRITDVTATRIQIIALKFPLESPGQRFQVVDTPVTYECNRATQQLIRHWGYDITAAQPTAFAADTPIALLATQVSSCNFTYTSGVTDRSGLVEMRLQLTRDGETITLYQAAQVNNVP